MQIVFFHWNKNNGPGIYRGFEPFINELKKRQEIQEFFVPYSGSNPVNLLQNIFFIHRHRTKTGINHITGDIHYGILGLIGTRSVLTIHDDYAIVKAKGGIIGKLYKWLFWIYLPVKLAGYTVCITPETQRKIQKRIKTKRITTITHHVVDVNLKKSVKPFNETCPQILQVGTDNHKNLETTLKAIVGIPCTLHVLKEMTARQHELARQSGIKYKNLYDIPAEAVNKEYDEADIVVFPSFYEGLGLPVLEGQAAGKPVITSNLAPMNWVAGDGAILLEHPTDEQELKEKILHVMNDRLYRDKIVMKGEVNLLRFTVENSVNQYVDLYNRLSD